MKTKKLTALALASAMAVSTMGMGVSAEEPIELTYWALNTKQEAFDPLTEAFNEANPDIHVTISYYDVDGIKDSCKVAASSDTLPSAWFNCQFRCSEKSYLHHGTYVPDPLSSQNQISLPRLYSCEGSSGSFSGNHSADGLSGRPHECQYGAAHLKKPAGTGT